MNTSTSCEVDAWLQALDNAIDSFEDEADIGPRYKVPIRVARIDYTSVTSDDFLERYSRTRMPIILGNAESHLPMHLTVDYWQRDYADTIVPLDVNTPSQRNVRLGDYLKFSDSDLNKHYCRSLHTYEWFPEENKLLKFPPVFGRNHLHERGKGYPQGWISWFELFISTRECKGFPFLHQDMCSTHAFSMQIQGIKRFVLYPPSDSQYLYTYGATGTRSSIPNDQILSGKVDLARYPAYSGATPYHADVRPGDIFFCPAAWWHTTTVVSAEPSVTLGGNFVDEANLADFESAWREYEAAASLMKVGAATIEHPGVVPARRPE